MEASSGGGKAPGNGTTSKPLATDGAEAPRKTAQQGAKLDATTASPVPAAAAASAAPAKPSGRPASKGGEGVSDEMLTQIAQAKFEAQEDKLRDVARQTVAMLRDYGRLPAADSDRRVAEIRKSLLKYEQQYIRASVSQEQRRHLETKVLEAEAERCRQEAEDEGVKYIELRQVLEKERRRRKRYEHYEKLAKEVNKKKSRSESQTEIDAATAEIERVSRKRVELEAVAEARNQRAQLLRHAVAELKQDLQREQQLDGEVIRAPGSRSASDKAPQPTATQASTAADVEVIS
uniref:Uncharacterized protein n=1 Tax=Alexandrium monilatum TaxID=311494 RepID=A0A7S4QDL2_9DINO